ncbi:hypothetical protein EX30DRAFT_37048 [Ascodesmis nigricans]|uniref:SAC3/GANP/THP3 conserved domain-containing protein n=1 Tax=Ascodesmis nigricans TaxID=341454 RepID=A0A4S2MWQ5_9PEZI|nr:hypothetical protein EX30DRAFT_37048 [Ascodesmis nigricans]
MANGPQGWPTSDVMFNSPSGPQFGGFSNPIHSNPFGNGPPSSGIPNPFATTNTNAPSNPFEATTQQSYGQPPPGFGMAMTGGHPTNHMTSDMNMDIGMDSVNSFGPSSQINASSNTFPPQQRPASNGFSSNPFGAAGALPAINPFAGPNNQPAPSFPQQPTAPRHKITKGMVDGLLNTQSAEKSVVLYRAPVFVDARLIESSRCQVNMNTNAFGTTPSGENLNTIIQLKDLSGPYEDQLQFREVERSRLIKEGVIDDPDKPKNLDQAQVFKGQCNNKCPSHEVLQRVYQHAVDPLERDDSRTPCAELFVKRYHRPAAGIPPPLPRDVRTPQTLVATMDYMLHTLLEKYPLAEAHSFIRDRTRSVRQDFTFQDYRGKETVYAHELITRFHIISLHHLGGNSAFEVYPEMEQLGKTLTTLDQRYMDNYRQHRYFDTEPEFRAYYILLNAQDKDVESRVGRWPYHVQESKYVQLALHLRSLMESNTARGNTSRSGKTELVCENAFAFFNIVMSPKVPYLMTALLSVRFQEIRRNALNYLVSHSLRQQKYATLEWIKNKLAYESIAELEAELVLYEFEVGVSEAGERYLVTKQNVYAEDTPASRKPRFHRKLVESKAHGRSIPEAISEGDYINIFFHSKDDCEVFIPSSRAQKVVPKLLKAASGRSIRGFGTLLSPHIFASIAPQASSIRFADGNRTLAPVKSAPIVSQPLSKPSWSPSPSHLSAPKPPSFTPNALSSSPSLLSTTPLAHHTPHSFKSNPPSTSPSISSSTPSATQLSPSVFSSAQFGTPPSAQPAVPVVNPFARAGSPSSISQSPPSNPFATKPLASATATTPPANPFLSKKEDSRTNDIAGSSTLTGFRPVAPIIGAGGFANPFAVKTTLEIGGNTNNTIKPVSSSPAGFSFTPSAPPPTPSSLLFPPIAATTKPPVPSPSLQFPQTTTLAHIPQPTPPIQTPPPPPPPPPPTSASSTEELANEKKYEISERSTTPDTPPPLLNSPEPETNGPETPPDISEQETPEEWEEIADERYRRILLQDIFYPWMKTAIAKMKRREGILRRRLPKKKQDVQWWPVDRMLIPDGMLQDATSLVMKPVEIQDIFTRSVGAQLEQARLRNSVYRILCHFNDDTGLGDYWWHQKLLLGQPKLSYKLGNGNSLIVQTTCSPDELPTVGVIVFGCELPDGNPSLDNDCKALHNLTRQLVENGVRDSFGVMVVCFRAPGDSDYTDPIEITPRTTQRGREHRLDAISHALQLDQLDERIVHKEVVLVETLADVDLTGPLTRLANYDPEVLRQPQPQPHPRARAPSPKRRMAEAEVTTPEPLRRVKARTVAKPKQPGLSFLEKLRAAPRQPPPPPRAKPKPLKSERQAANYLMCQTRNLIPAQVKTGPRISETRELALRQKQDERKKELAAIVAQQTKEYEELHRFSVAVLTEASRGDPTYEEDEDWLNH